MSPRLRNGPWKRQPGTDRAYARRGERAKERDQWTPPGTAPNAMDPAKVERKRTAKAAHA